MQYSCLVVPQGSLVLTVSSQLFCFKQGGPISLDYLTEYVCLWSLCSILHPTWL